MKPQVHDVYALCLLYFAVSLIGILHHELWLDEAHHWLLARDSVSFANLVDNIRHDGHPVLWSALLYAVTRFTSDPFWMQLLNISIATLAVFVFVKKAPFHWPFKILFVFGYFMIFEYNIISRNYMLGVLFLFVACSLFKNPKRWFWFALNLSLAANTHLMFAVPALALFAIWLFNRKQHSIAKSTLIKGVLVFVMGMLLLAYNLKMADSGWFFESINQIPWREKCIPGFVSFFKALFPVPDFRTIHFWNSNLLINLSRTLSAIAAIVVYALPLLLFRNKKSLFFIYIALFGAQFFFFVTQRMAVRFDGMVYLVLIMALWMDADFEKTDTSAFSPKRYLFQQVFVYGMLLLHFFSGIAALCFDFQHPFTGAKKAVAYVHQNKLDALPVISVTCDGTMISAYLEKKVWFLCDQDYRSFCQWDFTCAKNTTYSQIEPMIANYMKTHNEAIYISNYQISEHKNRNLNIRMIKNFDGNILANSNYYIFRISKK